MPRDIVYFDLETQRTANDAGGWMRKGDMRMSIGVIFSTATGRYEVFGEAQVNRLIERLRRADLVIGFNVLNSDTITAYNTSYVAPTATTGSVWLTPTGIATARYVKFNFQIDF